MNRCREKKPILDWIRKWTEIRQELEQHLLSSSESEQAKWVAGAFTDWLDLTLDKFQEMSGHERGAVRREVRRLFQEAQRRMRSEACRNLREKLLRGYKQLLKEVGLEIELVNKLREDYWQNKNYED